MISKKKMLFILVACFLQGTFVACGAYTELNTEGTSTTGQSSSTIEYVNTEYGFSIDLPESWTGYSISTDTWEASRTDGQRGSAAAGEGPVISIVHPLSTAEQPRQDIPIMVFSIRQWELVQDEIWRLSAAPMPPGELGRNSTYVFALPPRYNYSYLQGWEEVEQILEDRPIRTFEPSVPQ